MPAAAASSAVAYEIKCASMPRSMKAGIRWTPTLFVASITSPNTNTSFQNVAVRTASARVQEYSS